MALGKRQRETLGRIVDLCTKELREGHVRADIKVGRQRAYTRELGEGIAVTVTPVECYPEGEYPMQAHWIADCSYVDTAVRKSEEIARYLVEQGVPSERIRLGK